MSKINGFFSPAQVPSHQLGNATVEVRLSIDATVPSKEGRFTKYSPELPLPISTWIDSIRFSDL